MYKKSFSNLLSKIYSFKKSVSSRVIYFHSISDSHIGSLHPKDFESFLMILKKLGLKGVSLGDFLSFYKENNDKAIRTSVAITFDDGYLDNLYFAAPLLLKYNFGATFFTITKSLNKGKNQSSNNFFQLYPDRMMLSNNDVVELSDLGFEIGSHSHSHHSLTSIYEKSPDNAYHELLNSRLILEDILSKQVSSFAYPYGQNKNFSKFTDLLALRSGYSSICNTIYGPYSNINFPFINRCEISHLDTSDIFSKKIHGHYDFLNYVHSLFPRGSHWNG